MSDNRYAKIDSHLIQAEIEIAELEQETKEYQRATLMLLRSKVLEIRSQLVDKIHCYEAIGTSGNGRAGDANDEET